ncbi:MAG TPA: ATP-binding protein [Verrucomicrobiae bacterium]|nr:ATP-binding protein [Verrucomicrobiae bacterium]
MPTNFQPSRPASDGPATAPPSEPFIPHSWLEGGLAILDAAGRVTEVNESLLNWLEQPSTALVGRSFWEILINVVPQWQEPLATITQGKSPFARLSLKLGGDAQSAQWFMLESARSADSSFVRLNSTLPPLSELEEAIWDEHLHSESARRDMFVRLLRAEAQLDRLMRRWPCVIFSQRPDFSLEFVSPNIEELTGISAENWSSQPRRFWELVHEMDAGELQQQFKRAAQTGADSTSTYRIRHALTGRVTYVLEHRQPAITQNGLLLGYEVAWLDVTRQTIAEKRLSTAAWKETLAVLTLGMAHDFRNIMAGIHSLSESFLTQINEQHPFEEGLSLIKKSSMQASQLVQRMINLHLGQTGERNYHDLNEIAKDLLELLSKILPRRIRVGTELATESLPVYVDLVELRQVVINLLLNAADAMPQGGSLTLRTSRHETMPALTNMKGVIPRTPSVCLTIQDTGCGIKERHLASIFDPFFTTKSKGSGLGLYNAGIAVEKHQGAISVESKEGVGTTFHIWLPQTDFSEPDSMASSPDAKRIVRRSLLLLGQSGELLDKTAEFLRSHNYHIVVATAPESLPELLQSSDYQFAGVMLLVEPNDRALDALLAEVRQQKEELKVVLKLAGCSQDDLNTQVLQKVNLVLSPDLSEADLLAKLERLLN